MPWGWGCTPLPVLPPVPCSVLWTHSQVPAPSPGLPQPQHNLVPPPISLLHPCSKPLGLAAPFPSSRHCTVWLILASFPLITVCFCPRSLRKIQRYGVLRGRTGRVLGGCWCLLVSGQGATWPVTQACPAKPPLPRCRGGPFPAASLWKRCLWGPDPAAAAGLKPWPPAGHGAAVRGGGAPKGP